LITTPLARLRPARAGQFQGGLISTTTVIRRILVVLAVFAALLGAVVFPKFSAASTEQLPDQSRYVSPSVGAFAFVTFIKPLEPAPPMPAAVPRLGAKGYLRPVPGQFLSGFGVRSDGMHTGVDLRGRTGEPILASRSGTVSGAACGSGYGICTMIDHGGGVVTLYAHMSVKTLTGGKVEQGQVIGLVGCTGSCEGPHLHFEVRMNGTRVDPIFYL
jgi:murein DD-endopeptidase MepM/ murein hydrolase activator NlpD